MYADEKKSGEAIPTTASGVATSTEGQVSASLGSGTAVALRGTVSEGPVVAVKQPGEGASTEAAPQKGSRRKRVVLLAAALVLLSGGGWFGYNWWTVGRFTVSTDDAYVKASNTTLAAKVSGYVSSVQIADNAYVHAGDIIAIR